MKKFASFTGEVTNFECVSNSEGERETLTDELTPAMPNEASSGPILQWRKLSGDANNKGAPWRASSNLKQKDQLKPQIRRTKVSRQDTINEEARRSRKRNSVAASSLTKRATDDGKRHVVPTKKAQYTHLVSLAKEEDKRPIVYGSSEDCERKQEVAPLWLQSFGVVEDC